MDTILLIEGNPIEARRLSAVLADEYRVVQCPDGRDGPAAARRCSATAIVAGLPSLGPERHSLLRRLATARAPVIAVSPVDGLREVVEAMRSGAADFLKAPCPAPELKAAIRAASGRALPCTPAAGPFIGCSELIRQAAAKLTLFAASDYPVLIVGESGTGKEIAARALHRFSARAAGPFIARNCAALPELLVESELFGTERGAFTDAVARPGAFELADGGVLFLDEIGEAGAPLQAKLLRALESGETRRLGGKFGSEVDLRLVSATNRNLREAPGAFRTDLLYRIDTLVLTLPSLRSRREDIPELAAYFALDATRGKARFGRSALDKLRAHDWPGNVRELRNVVHRALVLAGPAEEIEGEHIVF